MKKPNRPIDEERNLNKATYSWIYRRSTPRKTNLLMIDAEMKRSVRDLRASLKLF